MHYRMVCDGVYPLQQTPGFIRIIPGLVARNRSSERPEIVRRIAEGSFDRSALAPIRSRYLPTRGRFQRIKRVLPTGDFLLASASPELDRVREHIEKLAAQRP